MNDDIGAVTNPLPPPATYIDRRSTLTIVSDAAGSVRFAVTGYYDLTFDGINNGSPTFPHDQTGQYTVRVTHMCSAGSADINGDCVVDGADIAALLNLFGTKCP